MNNSISITEIMERKCITCQVCKPLNQFHKSKGSYLGRFNICKPCRSSSRKRHVYDKPINVTLTCAMCKEEKNSSDFHADKSSKSGCQTYCKNCSKIKMAKFASTFNGFMTLLWADLQNNAKNRNIKVDISKQDIIDLYKKQKGLCALTDIKMTHEKYTNSGREKRSIHNISVDRIESKKHYTKDNIQLVSSIVNTMKWDLDMIEFVIICKK